MRGLTVWTSKNGQDWQQIWQADPYHIAMGRDWYIKTNTIVQAKYIRVGLRSKDLVQLAEHDDRGKNLEEQLFYLNSIYVYGSK